MNKPIKIGNTYGYKSCPKWLHDKYREAVNYHCQSCKKHEDKVGKLIPHRITRGHKGGLYTVVPLNDPRNNVKILCKGCHSEIHSGEFNKK